LIKMKTLQIENPTKIKKAIPKIERKIKIRLNLNKNNLTIKGEEINEFLVEKIILAVDFGFDVEDALLLKNEDFTLEFINIKEHTRRKNLEEVRSRVIGTKGKAKRTIEELAGAVLVIHDNVVGAIVDSEHLEDTTQGIISLIQGAKHGNVFAYLEKQNAKRRRGKGEDLGLKAGFGN
jgi:ribosomal RNA assembly protein